MGNISVRLFNDTPAHRDNFLKLVNDGYYDGTLFHRVIKDFMIQGGDPDSRTAAPGQMLGTGGPSYTLPAEIVYPAHFHKRGMLAAARQGDQVNPERRSSGSQFYIVTGKKYTAGQLDQMERRAVMQYKQDMFNSLAAQHRDSIMALRRNRDAAGLQALQDSLAQETERLTADHNTIYTPKMRQVYMTEGGTPHLDGAYTVYGRVLEGMDVVEKIEAAETDANDRPIEDIRIISASICSLKS